MDAVIAFVAIERVIALVAIKTVPTGAAKAEVEATATDDDIIAVDASPVLKQE